MDILIILLTYLVLVIGSEEQEELNIDYHERLIKNAFAQVKTYKPRQDNSDYFNNTTNTDEVIEYGTFDFIVVGSGSSGSVIASRLTEIEKFNVLLLEAGEWIDDLVNIPYYASILQFSKRDWGYFTTPQKNSCYGWENNMCSYARGKILGGSGSINYLLYARGNRADYDGWESLGNPGWSFDDVLPYFKKSENFESPKIDREFRGFAGPLNVAYQVQKNAMIMYDAYKEIGVDAIDDYNGKQQIGVSEFQIAMKYGRRESGASAYVRPAAQRHNFNITLNALVIKILIEKSTNKAYGVNFVKDGKVYQAIARKEVILSAGAVNTPQLLMLSGIGPKDELKKHNIPVIRNLPVGKYLKEHPGFRITFESNVTAEAKPLRELIRDYLNGRGVLTSYLNDIAISYVNTRNTSSPVPNIEIIFAHQVPFCKPVPDLTRYTKEVKEYMKKIDLRRDLTASIFVLNPRSVGSLTLKSNSPIDFPQIDVGMFTDPYDLEIHYEGIQIVSKLGKTKAAAKINAEELRFQFCNQYQYNSREYWFCALKHLGYPTLHISSTAKMGPTSDPMAVVDHKLRVYGIKRLRVADISIMPTTMSGHTNAPALMIGEKAADLIKQDHMF